MPINALNVNMLPHCVPTSPPLAISHGCHHLYYLNRSLKRCSSHTTASQRPTLETEVPRLDPDLDDELSKRPLNLDAAGYYLIRIEKDSREIVSEYYTNIINKNGKRRDLPSLVLSMFSVRSFTRCTCYFNLTTAAVLF
jgi:hypothetical protein